MSPYEVFDAVTRSLKKEKWFAKGKWMCSTHLFPPEDPEALTFHLSKKNWFNEERQGIHIEPYLYLDPQKRRKSSVCLHLFHHDFIPGTRLKRREISVPVVDEIYDEVCKWKGYKFRAGRYGLQPFEFKLDGSDPSFENSLVMELKRIALRVGDAIDRVLLELKLPL